MMEMMLRCEDDEDEKEMDNSGEGEKRCPLRTNAEKGL